MERTAGRAAFWLSMTTTPYSQAALAFASGRSSCVSLGLVKAGARKKSSPQLVGIVRAFVALSGVRAIIVAGFDAAHHLVGDGGYKKAYVPIELRQIFVRGFLM